MSSLMQKCGHPWPFTMNILVNRSEPVMTSKWYKVVNMTHFFMLGGPLLITTIFFLFFL